MKNQTELVTALRNAGLKDELSMDQGGLCSAEDIADEVENLSLTTEMLPIAQMLAEHSDQIRAHELLHCFDVAAGGVELAAVMAESGIPEELYAPHTPQDVFLAGIFHDLVLGIKQESLETVTPREALKAIASPEYQAQFDSALYLKHRIEDDFFGAVLIDTCGIDRPELKTAVVSAAPHDQVGIQVTNATLLQKVLDAIAYHDGNYPIRGHAEAQMLVGDRLPLYDREDITADDVGQGIKKLLTYSEIDSQWEQRSTQTDTAYLAKKLGKKAPGFLEVVEGTRVYDFLVEQLVPRQRSKRTLNSATFLAGVQQMPEVLRQLEQRPELAARYAEKIETLYQRHEQAQQIIRAYQ